MIKRAIAAGEVLSVRRGLYCLAGKYLRQPLSPLALAQRIYGPSYVSLESALSWHGWIPEAVPSVLSVCGKRAKQFDTPLGAFRFIRVPQRMLFLCVQRVETEDGSVAMVARPLKALADYLYAHKQASTSCVELLDSLRIESGRLSEIANEDIEALLGNYPSRRVGRFLKALKKELPGCR